MIKETEKYIKVSDLKYKNGILCKSHRVPSQTAGIEKGDNCKKLHLDVLACSNRVGKLIKPSQLRDIYHRWNKQRKMKPVIY